MIKKYLPFFIALPCLLLLVLGLIAACTYQSETGNVITLTASPLPVTVQPETKQPSEVAEDPKGYPSTPEAVVQAFLLALQASPELAPRYLSVAQNAALPAGGATELLLLPGVIEGVALQSGAASLNPPGAQVDVGFQVKEESSQRRFHLIKENDRWVIDLIEVIK